MASALGAAVRRVASAEGAAFGAAILAGLGAHAWPSVADACRQTIQVIGDDEPDPSWQERYTTLHNEYRAMYPALRDRFHALAR